MAETPDLLVVGGGPAGLATAIEARLAGLEVVVIDRRRPPIDVACGEGLMPGGRECLDRLGAIIAGSEGRVFTGIRYIDGTVTAEARFGSTAGIGVRRETLHQALACRAEELGAEIRWGVSATGYDGFSVASDGGPVHADLVVAADGRFSRLRRWAGIRTRQVGLRRGGIRRHYRLEPWTDLVEVHWADAGEAYVTPVGPDLVGVAVLSADRPLDFDRLLGHFPHLDARLAAAIPVSRDRGAGPFGQRPETVICNRLALVGDASGCLDPITGEGISVAFRQAHELVKAICKGDLGAYAHAHRGIMRLPLLVTALLIEAEKRPPIRRIVIRLFSGAPWLFSRLVRIVAGTRPPAVPP